MDLTLLAVGRLRPGLREVCDEYERRLARQLSFREVEIREASRAPTPAVQRREEARRLDQRLPKGALVVCLARTGQPWSSEELARRVAGWTEGGRRVAIVIGGSHGLDDDFLAAATAAWSLGQITLPHELARVVVVEQLYRAGTILRGEPYHKARGRQ